MKVRSLQLLILLLLVLAGIILLVQNGQSLTLIVLNQPVRLTLPLSIWVILAVIAGLFTSLLWRGLMSFGSRDNIVGDRLNRRFSSLKQRPERQPEKKPRKSDWEKSRAGFDWTDEDIDDEDIWDIESPPPRTTQTRPPQKRSASAKPPSRPTAQEADIPPARSAPSDPAAQQARQQPPPSKEGVYDANYRVITPPYNPQDSSPEDDDNNEEWI